MAIDSKNLLTWVKSMSRGQALPLDSTEVWDSLASAEDYAKNNATAYVGQSLKVVDATNGTVSLYVIKDTAGNLSRIPDSGDIRDSIQDVEDLIPEGFTISATGSGDTQIEVTPTGGTNSVDFDVAHKKVGPASYTPTTAAATVSGYGASGSIKVPKVTVNEYGHVTAVDEQEFKVEMPSEPNLDFTKVTLKRW